jgi:hypothetical protein
MEVAGRINSLRTLREAFLAVGLIAFGMVVFPAVIYAVGQRVIGDYEAGLMGFYESIASELAGGNPYAWLLILAPYLGVLLIRIGFRLRKPAKSVNQVTD